MDQSRQLRKDKVKARMRLRRRLAKGQVRLEDVSIAASAQSCTPEAPLILTRVTLPEYTEY